MKKMKKIGILLVSFAFLLVLGGTVNAVGPTSVSGGLYKNTTWYLSDSPYVVTGDITLFPDYTLTIEPGVEVRFSSGTGIEVRGTLVAEGTEESPIVFTSDDLTSKGAWRGVEIANTLGGKATIKFAKFSYASTALSVRCCGGGGPVNIYDSGFSNNVTALGGYAGWKMIVERCTFENNTYAITSADKTISDSVFKNNDYGLYATERISVYSSTFEGSQVALYGGRGEVKFCEIFNNGTGIQAFFEGFTLSKNTIRNNDIGVILAQYDTYTPPVEYNNIYDNMTYNLRNSSPADKEAKHNWWGTTDTAEINAKIYDGYDNVALGIVFYLPILTVPVDITPPPEIPPEPVCGNGILDPGEACDDGNTVSGDGCSNTCQTEAPIPPVCGNGILDPGEACDDGNTISGDGCSSICQTEAPIPPVCPCEGLIARITNLEEWKNQAGGTIQKIQTELTQKSQEIDELKSWRQTIDVWKASIDEFVN